MKIAIISNCQGESLAACIREMTGTINPEFILVTKLWDGSVTVADVFKNYDVVVAQRFVEQHIDDTQRERLVLFPDLVFSAFHPDMTYLRGKRIGGQVETIFSPLLHYNSSLVVYGYVRGLSADEIEASFNKNTYSKLGYLNTLGYAEAALRQEFNAVNLDLDAALHGWKSKGCFMHTFNHPELFVVADVAKAVLKKLGIDVVNHSPARYMPDSLRALPVWPIYPEIAKELSLAEKGDYAFKPAEPHGIMGLRAFIDGSIASYEQFERDTIEPINFNLSDFDRLLSQTTEQFSNPYRNLPDAQFWKKAVATPPMSEVDPVYGSKFAVEPRQKVATAGSCFAQHIARTLSANGFNYFVSESAPNTIAAEEAMNRNYGVFSARYGNIYTSRQLVQLIKRVNGQFAPNDNVWTRKDGRLVDPFRPQIEPDGFESIEALQSSREMHFAAVRDMLKNMDVFVFTLGLTESWRAKSDGAVFPLAPGVAGGTMDFDKYEFINFSAAEVVADMNEFIAMLAEINPACKVILTVSPVPLIATYEPKHVLTATTYSKSVLRVAAEELSAAHAHVGYFPSYEVITGGYNRGAYFDEDLRTVTNEGVSHVMRLFMKHYAGAQQSTDAGHDRMAALASTTEDQAPPSIHKNVFGIVCDEEAIANFSVDGIGVQ